MIEATRARLSSTGEWLTAALFFVITCIVALLVVRELRVAPRAFAAATAATAATATSAAVPAEAVSVPALMLGAHEIRVGDSARDTLRGLDPSIALVKQVDEQGPLGRRTGEGDLHDARARRVRQLHDRTAVQRHPVVP